MKTAMEKIEKLRINLKKKVPSSFIKNKKVVQPSSEEYEQNGIIVGVKCNLHCLQCLKDVENCIKKFNGVLEVETEVKNLKESEFPSKAEVTVKGVFDPTWLKNKLKKTTGKTVDIYVKEEKPGRNLVDASSSSGNGGEHDNEIKAEEEADDDDHVNHNDKSEEIEEVKE